MSGRNGSARNGSNDGSARRSKMREYLDDDDDTLVMDPAPMNDFSELDDDDAVSPADRRRDPLRRKI